MTTETSICNLALAECGSKRVASIDDSTNEARICKTFYEQVRDEVLRSHPWNFAMERAILSELTPAPLFGWCKKFGLPSDFLRLVEMNDWEAPDGVGPTEMWVIEGSALLTNEDCARIRYVSAVTDTSKFDALFTKALSTLLASKIATNITGDRTLGPQLLARYENVDGPKARRIDAGEGSPNRRMPYTDSDLVRSRYQRFF